MTMEVGCLLLGCFSCQDKLSVPPCDSRVAELMPSTELRVLGSPHLMSDVPGLAWIAL